MISATGGLANEASTLYKRLAFMHATNQGKFRWVIKESSVAGLVGMMS